MQYLKMYDLWVLDNIYQKLYNWIWRRWDVSNFTISRGCIVVYEALFVGESITRHDYFLAGLSIVLLIVCLLWTRIAENNHSNLKFLNPSRESESYIRCIQVIILVLFFIPPIDYQQPMRWVLFTSFLYFMAVQRQPPIERKSFVWMKGLVWQ